MYVYMYVHVHVYVHMYMYEYKYVPFDSSSCASVSKWNDCAWNNVGYTKQRWQRIPHFM